MKKQKNCKYNLWKNTAFMLKLAWNICKTVPLLCVSLSVVTVGLTSAQLLITPAILNKVETLASLHELILTIAIFSGVLLVLSGLREYINTNTLYGRIAIRTSLIQQVGIKFASTSFPNILKTEFINLNSKARHICFSNSEATEHIWTTWTEILTNMIGFVIYLLLLSNLNPVLVSTVILTTAVGYFVNKKILDWGYVHREEEAALLQRMQYIQTVGTGRDLAKDIRIFGLKDWIDDVWNSTMSLYRTFLTKREQKYLWMNVIDLLLNLLRNGIAYLYLLWLTLRNGLSASEFLLYFSALSGFTVWVRGILDQFSQLHKESLDINSLREYLEYPEPFQFDGGKPIPPCSAYEIRLENVSYRYPEATQDTICNLQLTIRPGENLAIVGLNGAGKTTLVKLICGFLDPTQGRILLNGEDIRLFHRRDYYDLFSAVFQEFSVLEATVKENVAQKVDDMDDAKVWQCLNEAGLAEKIQDIGGLSAKIGRKVYEDGVELSGGQIQRLMLARALYKNGAILILDEPTAALDPIAENDIYQKYSEMTDGKTSVFISHRLASTRFCDRILFMENGQICEEGTHETLLNLGGGYAKLFEVQSRYYQEGSDYHEK